ncbi:uncharacterized protein LOC131250832 isoform X2 [Magnolia sinica]|uniref:uncharacterized protein LOC131250832 isoform X2 n=1 Tax=Magnolia sinica TaxID=86752 RepID=UPI002657B1DC|nr:uncharacterized protein LOC131250832 isoform X2 [Magnolia sinica]
MEMQLLYSKLHDKYTELKMRKESEIEQYNREQKSKFMNYISAAEEMIEHLKTANESLQAKINELTDKIIPDRSAEEYQYAEYQKLLIEERQKTKELSEEVERLRNLLQEKSDSIDKNDDSIDGQLKSPYGGSQLRSRDLSEGSAGLKTLRPCSGVQTEEVMVIPNAGSQEEHVMVKEPERGPGKGMPYSDALGNSQQPCSCRRTMASSGYSFSLTWVKNVVGEEPELLYHVVSLGTFERLAPEWMREDLIFSMSMCAIFFERVLQVTRLHC